MKGKTVFETGFIRVQLLRHKYSLHATAKLCDGERERKKKKERKKPWVKINKKGKETKQRAKKKDIEGTTDETETASNIN